jgi:ABC-type multidrug transport system ATPase subunit
MIKADGISVEFDNNPIITSLSFSAEKGEKLCFHGPSGGGKTTLLKTIIGFIDLKSGSITIDNKVLNANNINSIRRKVAWLPQNINLPVQTGEELAREMMGVKNLDPIYSFFEKFGLEKNILHKDLEEISGGQKQRMILSIVLSLNRPVLLLDEPTSALDEESVQRIIDVIFQLKEITVISTSHNPKWIENCDHKIKIG